MITHLANTNHQERIEAISARLNFLAERMNDPAARSIYYLPTSGKQIDFDQQQNGWKLSRLIWRIGELKLRTCLDQLLTIQPLLVTEFDYYAFIWSLGRIGRKQDAQFIQTIQTNFKDSELIQTIAKAVLLQLLPKGADYFELRKTINTEIPKTVTNALKLQSVEEIVTELNTNLNAHHCNDWLYYTYLLNWKDESVSKALLEVLSNVPLKGNYFKPIRKILKVAELYEDAEMMALLYWRMYFGESSSFVKAVQTWEKDNRGNWRSKIVEKYAISHADNQYHKGVLRNEVKKDNTPFGFTDKTKNYYKNKFLRVLFRIGDAQSVQYTKLATAYLLLIDESNAKPAWTETIYKYNYDRTTRRYNTTKEYIYYPTAWNDFPFHKILHGNTEQFVINARLKGVHSRSPIEELESTGRTELYPELWNKADREVIRLLAQSESDLVQQFAHKVYQVNPQFAEAIEVSDLIQMLQRSFRKTNELAINIIQDQYERFQSETAVFVALLSCQVETGVDLAFRWLDENKAELLKSPAFLQLLINHPNDKVNAWIKAAVVSTAFSKQQRSSLFSDLLNSLVKGNSEQISVSKTIDFIQTALAEESKTISTNKLRTLVNHTDKAIQLFGGFLIQNHDLPLTELPYTLLLTLMETADVEVQAMGIRLFGQLPEEELYRQQLIVSNCCVSKVAAVREAIKPTVMKLAFKYPDFGEALTETLVDFFHLRGKATPIHDFIAELLTTPAMRPYLGVLTEQQMWRLLNSKKYPAQLVGFEFLKQEVDGQSLEMEAIVQLGKHEVQAIRMWAFAAILQQTPRAIYEADKVLRLLETDWEDSRTFMMDFAKTQFKARDWTPELLVSLCDSTRAEVQTFGMAMIQQYFQQENAVQFLLQLSQHPSQRIQLMAAKWLNDYASDNFKLLQHLKPFFLTLLSQINKGRTAKKHVYAFLEQEALKAPEIADFIIPILERLVLTVAIGDKSKCIFLLNQIRRKFPHLSMRMQQGKALAA